MEHDLDTAVGRERNLYHLTYWKMPVDSLAAGCRLKCIAVTIFRYVQESSFPSYVGHEMTSFLT